MATQDGKANAEAFLAERPATSIGSLRVVDRSWSELEALRGQLDGDWPELEQSGFDLTSLGIDVRNNTVVLGISETDPSHMADIAKRYGSGVVTITTPEPQPGACVDRGNCWNPAKAGLWLTTPGGTGCTSGFVASDGIGGNVYLFTAGHCGGGTYKHNGVSIGSSTRSSFYNNSPADAWIIDIANAQESNLLYKSPTNLMHITGRLLYVYDYVGMVVCVQSWYYGVNCGTITHRNVSSDWSGLHWVHQRRGNFFAHDGDSGGPVYMGSSATAEGLLAAHSGEHDWWFAQISYAEYIDTPLDELLTCTTMSC